MQQLEEDASLTDEDLLERVVTAAQEAYDAKVALVGRDNWAPFERSVMLQSIDSQWRSHLAALDHLRQGIHLRGYAQRDPKQEYKREAFELFSDLLDRIRVDVIRLIMTVKVQSPEEVEQPEPQQTVNVSYHHSDYDTALSGEDAGSNPPAQQAAAQQAAGDGQNIPRVGRNQPCPCGSGKKYKHCHGKLT